MTAVLAGALIALAVRLALGPRGRRSDVLSPGAGEPATTRLARRDSRAVMPAPVPVVAVAQVAALLRSGAPPVQAWRAVTGARCDPDGVPDVRDLARRAPRADPRQVAGLVSAARLAAEVGAPLAQVLDDVGGAMASADDARAQRDAALAGPRATARVLAWMPAAGLGLGYALGADPVSVLLGGGFGTFALALGAAFLESGRRWTRALVASAERDGEPP